MSSCTFCSDPSISERTIYRNPLVFTFPTNIPIVPGHVLVCPTRHVATIDELTDEELGALRELIVRIKAAVRASQGAEGFNVAWNEGSVAGQSVGHLHVHVVPRIADDAGIHKYDPRAFLYRPGSRAESPESELREVAGLIRNKLYASSIGCWTIAHAFPMVAKDQKIGVATKAVLFDGNGNILTLRRSKTAPSRPLHWDLPGGDLDFGEDVRDGIVREIREETGLEVQDVQLLDVLSGLNDNGEYWVTICYTARPTTTEVILSDEHDDFQWVTTEAFGKLKASPRNQKFVEKFKCLKNSH